MYICNFCSVSSFLRALFLFVRSPPSQFPYLAPLVWSLLLASSFRVFSWLGSSSLAFPLGLSIGFATYHQSLFVLCTLPIIILHLSSLVFFSGLPRPYDPHQSLVFFITTLSPASRCSNYTEAFSLPTIHPLILTWLTASVHPLRRFVRPP